MIIEEKATSNPVSSDHNFPRKAVLELIFQSIENTVLPFVRTVKPYINVFNEDNFTQEFIEKNDYQLSKLTNCIGVKCQYHDLVYKTKGIPDIYYHFREEDGIRKPIFVMEAKVLPAPSKSRDKEYVYGYRNTDKPSGGIQRFKMELHGKGHNQCGMLAYVLSDNFENWQVKINEWIQEVGNGTNSTECINAENSKKDLFIHLNSKVIRQEEKELELHHFWIEVK